ncbi:uncharacterized protein CELE_F22E5.2 [Caenorhabditis elegans]|uniref:Secreted protein n=1 Tax=Caenorhabditis elegans TaxID=6239 RepID=O16716_CAEEL|nr:Secreted protein [Caenorhabditis elegans]CCD68449.2 Secreted protein [Caenorhabditis elegans]
MSLILFFYFMVLSEACMRTVAPEDVYISSTFPFEDFTTEAVVTTDSSTISQLTTETTMETVETRNVSWEIN